MPSETHYILTLGEAQYVDKRLREQREQDAAQPEQQADVPGKRQRALFRVVSVHDDYLTCRMIGGASGTLLPGEISVAKPEHLQRTPFDGKTWHFEGGPSPISYEYDSHRKRTETRDSDGETNVSVVTPDYRPGDKNGGPSNGEIILAWRVVTPWTDAEGRRIRWIEHSGERSWHTISDFEEAS